MKNHQEMLFNHSKKQKIGRKVPRKRRIVIRLGPHFACFVNFFFVVLSLGSDHLSKRTSKRSKGNRWICLFSSFLFAFSLCGTWGKRKWAWLTWNPFPSSHHSSIRLSPSIHPFHRCSISLSFCSSFSILSSLQPFNFPFFWSFTSPSFRSSVPQSHSIFPSFLTITSIGPSIPGFLSFRLSVPRSLYPSLSPSVLFIGASMSSSFPLHRSISLSKRFLSVFSLRFVLGIYLFESVAFCMNKLIKNHNPLKVFFFEKGNWYYEFKMIINRILVKRISSESDQNS